MIRVLSFFRLIETGATKTGKSHMAIFLLAVLLISLCAFASAEENIAYYTYEDFDSFLKLSEETYFDHLLDHSITVSYLVGKEISVQVLFDEFPYYTVLREETRKKVNAFGIPYDSFGYITYHLKDDSILYIFFEKEMLCEVCHMKPRCSPEEFAKIKEGRYLAEDVIAIDANSSFNPVVSYGPVTYHCLSDGTYRRVIYEQSLSNLERFVVSKIEEIQQDDCRTMLAYIFTEDMPDAKVNEEQFPLIVLKVVLISILVIFCVIFISYAPKQFRKIKKNI